MNDNNGKLSCAQAKAIDLVSFLHTLGYVPDISRTPNFWYRSPLRNEKTASFHVNRTKNCWYDHGIGKGGNLVDFGILYYACTVRQLLDKISSTSIAPMPVFQVPRKSVDKKASPIKVIRQTDLQDSGLIHYLKSRLIPRSDAKEFCCEVLFEINHRTHLAIGFPNDAGGLELRNAWFKGSTSPKASRVIHGCATRIRVFEGFMDFLTFRALTHMQPSPPSDYLVLNSTALFSRAIPLLQSYPEVQLFLDHDKTGMALTQQALSLGREFVDHSGLYNGYKDVNDWMREIGKAQKSGQKIR